MKTNKRRRKDTFPSPHPANTEVSSGLTIAHVANVGNTTTIKWLQLIKIIKTIN